MNSTAQAWSIAREIAAKQGTGSKEWYGLAHYILTLPERIEQLNEDNEMNEITNFNLTMTSLEISELVESEHPKVRQSIERLASRGAIQLPPMGKVENKQSLSPNNKTSVYLFTGEQGKRDSTVVVAQLSPEFTARLVDRWIELEAQVKAPALPDFSDPAAAARAWADQYEQKAKALAQLEAAQPAIEFHERVADDDGLHSIDEVAKALNAPPMKFRALLKKELDLFRLDGLPRQPYLDRGYMRVIETALPNGKIYPQPMFTGKGMFWVQQRLDHELMGVLI